MQWSEVVAELVQPISGLELTPLTKKRIMSVIDLTSLNDTDTPDTILKLLPKAHGLYGHVAGICVYPQFIRLVADHIASLPIRAATVANFPGGDHPLDDVQLEIAAAISQGAQEIDVVFPYERYLAGEQKYAMSFVHACREVCGDNITLKVILETGALDDLPIIADASYDAFAAGADFIKTSTGKIAQGATLEAAATMLLVIQHIQPQIKRNIGLKISGGIRSLQDAANYLQLVDKIMGPDWATPSTFRIGASKLVDELG